MFYKGDIKTKNIDSKLLSILGALIFSYGKRTAYFERFLGRLTERK